jgi:hypothetical protein
LFQSFKQSQRADKGIQAPFRENPRERAIEDSGVRRRLFQIPRVQEWKSIMPRDGKFIAL